MTTTKTISSTTQLRTLMRQCEQTKGMDVLMHGRLVAKYFEDLRLHTLQNKPLKYQWRLPKWAISPTLWDKLMPLPKVRAYQIYHDCGKPLCHYKDSDERSHFPDHANVSADLWRTISPDSIIEDLIRSDMQIHLLKAKDVEKFCQKDTAITLLLTGLAELHANASMFGGVESTSFKIKYKQINQRGKAVVKHFAEKNLIAA